MIIEIGRHTLGEAAFRGNSDATLATRLLIQCVVQGTRLPNFSHESEMCGPLDRWKRHFGEVDYDSNVVP